MPEWKTIDWKPECPEEKKIMDLGCGECPKNWLCIRVPDFQDPSLLDDSK